LARILRKHLDLDLKFAPLASMSKGADNV